VRCARRARHAHDAVHGAARDARRVEDRVAFRGRRTYRRTRRSYNPAVSVRVLLDPTLAPALSAAGLASAARILRFGGDPDAKAFVGFADLPVEGTCGRFHVKRYRYDGWSESRRLLGRGTLWGSAPEVSEFRALAWLREKAVPAVRPVAAAATTRRGRLVAHALVTELVPGAVDLRRRLETPGDPVREDARARRSVLEGLARHLDRMHAEGFVHRDAHARNVLVRLDDDAPRLWLCDCRRGGPPSWRHGTAHDLATIDADLDGRVPRTDRLRALRAYLHEGASLAREARTVLAARRKVERRRRRRARRRAPE
jgi:tRNA A-37 threonylcarbamoyl transferase component Bud32